MMQLTNSRMCSECKTATDFSELKLMPSGQRDYKLMCRECSATAKSRAGTVQPESRKLGMKDAKPVQSNNSDKQVVVCGHCRFRSRMDLDKAGRVYTLRCQYCGKNDKLMDKNGTPI